MITADALNEKGTQVEVAARRKRQKRLTMVVFYGIMILAAAAANPITYRVTNLTHVSYFGCILEIGYYMGVFVNKLNF